MSSITVFISYSHDSAGHRERVLALSERLRADGIGTLLDQYINGSPEQGWPRWMLDQLDAANSVVVVCTETYYRRFRGHEVPGKGKGVDWEGALITQEIYARRSRTLKFVPVLLSAADEDWIPDPLRSATHYALTSETAYESLYDFLLQQAGVEPHPIGTLESKPRRKGTALTFGDPAAPVRPVDISRIIKYAPSELIGREAETKLLTDAWDKVIHQDEKQSPEEKKRPHILTFVALGGEGKTSLVAKWAADLAHQDWPGCDAVFAWSFYSQGTREQTAVSSDLFLAEALTFFGDAALAGSAQGAFDKGRRLAQLVGERRALLILDGLEPLQYAPTSPTPGELKDQGLSALLKGLAAVAGEHTRPACWSRRPRRDGLPGAARYCANVHYGRNAQGSSLRRGRRSQHAGRVRSPDCRLPRRLRARGADAQVGRAKSSGAPLHRPRPPHPGPRRALRGDPGIPFPDAPEPRWGSPGREADGHRRRTPRTGSHRPAPPSPFRLGAHRVRRLRPPPRRHERPSPPRPPHPRLAAESHWRAYRPRERAERPGRSLGNRRARPHAAVYGGHSSLPGAALWNDE